MNGFTGIAGAFIKARALWVTFALTVAALPEAVAGGEIDPADTISAVERLFSVELPAGTEVIHDEGKNSAFPSSGYFIVVLQLPDRGVDARIFCDFAGGNVVRLFDDAATRHINISKEYCATLIKDGNVRKRIIRQERTVIFTADW